MDEKQLHIIGECLTAAASGRFIPDWEFSALFGLELREVADIAAAWPHVDQNEETVTLAINNSFGTLTGYPIDRPEEWHDYISVTPEELLIIFYLWKGNPKA